MHVWREGRGIRLDVKAGTADDWLANRMLTGEVHEVLL